jgi:hypothetical protein
VLHGLECVGVGLEDPGAGSVLILAKPLHAWPPVLCSQQRSSSIGQKFKNRKGNATKRRIT